jgi:LPS export ABC transporter protein LptC
MMQQFKLILVAGVVALLIFFSIEFYNQLSNEAQIQENVNVVDYEGYSEGINTIRFNAEGKVDYTLQAVRQISYKNAITELEEPLIQLYRGSDSHWNITANSGTISTSSEGQTNDEQIDLIGEVEVYQLDSFGNRTVLTTDFLSIDPVQEILTTESLVTMYSENHEQSAIGMRANLNNDEFLFQREVRGRYAAESN